MGWLNVAALRLCTESEGPGRRAALWVQGCARRCKGCCNPEMQPFERKTITATADLIKVFEREINKSPVEGISLIGGEPILQAEGLCDIAEWFRAEGMSVLMFTGYMYEELLSMSDPHVARLLKSIDLLIDGEYMEDRPDEERSWIGSSNQRVHRLTDFYPAGIEYRSKDRTMEILISSGNILVNGYPF